MTRRRLKIDRELIWHQRQRSLQLSPEFVWPAAIPVLGLPHPIMLCLSDWRGTGITGGSSRCLQEAPSSPLWHKKQSIDFFFPPHRLFSRLVSPICKRSPFTPPLPSAWRAAPLPHRPTTTTTTTYPHPWLPKNPSILRCISSAQRPNSSEPALFSIIDFHHRQSFHTFNSVIFHINYSGLPAYEYKSIMSACYPPLQLGDWRWYFMGAGDRRSHDYTVQTLSA